MKIKKIKKTIKISNFFEERSVGSIARVFLSSFIVISFFYATPIMLKFSEKNFYIKEFTNNSNKILNKALNKKKY